eukprot:GHRR01028304.1.p1 GENE.GHRR01028304.1~~GHRR01028304.1.p1  ORF type:complete len:203 (+),score=66.65 GHRR01028304.1:453-1061(+)
MNSWSHATNYPPLVLSGMVDLLHHYSPLPAGIPHGFLSLGFGTSAFLMLAHTKPEPLDGLVHQLLGLCMAGVSVTVLASGIWPRSFAVGAAKSLMLMMEGCWFFAITHILFSGDVTWAASHPGDMTRIIFTPVLFAWIFIGLLCFMLAVFLMMQLALVGSRRHPKGFAGNKGKGITSANYQKYLKLQQKDHQARGKEDDSCV